MHTMLPQSRITGTRHTLEIARTRCALLRTMRLFHLAPLVFLLVVGRSEADNSMECMALSPAKRAVARFLLVSAEETAW